MELEIFFIFSDLKFILCFLSAVAGVFVITTKNPIISVFNLIVLYILVAFYLIYIGITYIGISYIVVYIGAIAILFLFVIMMIDIEVVNRKNNNYLPLLLFLLGGFLYSLRDILYNLGNLKIMSLLQLKDHNFISSFEQDILFNSISFSDNLDYFYNYNLFFDISNDLLVNYDTSYYYTMIRPNEIELNMVNTSFLTKNDVNDNNDILKDLQISSDLENNNYLIIIPDWDSAVSRVTQISAIGDVLYTTYYFFIYIVSVILLLAMVGAIILTAENKDQIRTVTIVTNKNKSSNILSPIILLINNMLNYIKVKIYLKKEIHNKIKLISNSIKNYFKNKKDWLFKLDNKTLLSVLLPLRRGRSQPHIQWYIDSERDILAFQGDENGRLLIEVLRRKIKEKVLFTDYGREFDRRILENIISNTNRELRRLGKDLEIIGPRHPRWQNEVGDLIFERCHDYWKEYRYHLDTVHNNAHANLIEPQLIKKGYLSDEDKDLIVKVACRKLESLNFDVNPDLLYKAIYRGFKFKNKYHLDTIININWDQVAMVHNKKYLDHPDISEKAREVVTKAINDYAKDLFKVRPELRNNMDALAEEVYKEQDVWDCIIESVFRKELWKKKRQNKIKTDENTMELNNNINNNETITNKSNIEDNIIKDIAINKFNNNNGTSAITANKNNITEKIINEIKNNESNKKEKFLNGSTTNMSNSHPSEVEMKSNIFPLPTSIEKSSNNIVTNEIISNTSNFPLNNIPWEKKVFPDSQDKTNEIGTNSINNNIGTNETITNKSHKNIINNEEEYIAFVPRNVRKKRNLSKSITTNNSNTEDNVNSEITTNNSNNTKLSSPIDDYVIDDLSLSSFIQYININTFYWLFCILGIIGYLNIGLKLFHNKYNYGWFAGYYFYRKICLLIKKYNNNINIIIYLKLYSIRIYFKDSFHYYSEWVKTKIFYGMQKKYNKYWELKFNKNTLISIMIPYMMSDQVNGDKQLHLASLKNNNSNSNELNISVDSIVSQEIHNVVLRTPSANTELNNGMMDIILKRVNKRLSRLNFDEDDRLITPRHPHWRQAYGDNYKTAFECLWNKGKFLVDQAHYESLQLIEYKMDKANCISDKDKDIISRIAVNKLRTRGFKGNEELVYSAFYKRLGFNSDTYDAKAIVDFKWENSPAGGVFPYHPGLFNDDLKKKIKTNLTSYVNDYVLDEKPELKNDLKAIEKELETDVGHKYMSERIMLENLEAEIEQKGFKDSISVKILDEIKQRIHASTEENNRKTSVICEILNRKMTRDLERIEAEEAAKGRDISNIRENYINHIMSDNNETRRTRTNIPNNDNTVNRRTRTNIPNNDNTVNRRTRTNTSNTDNTVNRRTRTNTSNNDNNINNEGSSSNSTNSRLSSPIDEYDIDSLSMHSFTNFIYIDIFYWSIGILGLMGYLYGGLIMFLNEHNYGWFVGYYHYCKIRQKIIYKKNNNHYPLLGFIPFSDIIKNLRMHTEDILGNLTYFTIVIIFIGLSLLLINTSFSLSLEYLDKGGGFECGFTSFLQTRERFNIIFYRVSLLFLVFDLEIILIFPYPAIYEKDISTSKNNVLAFLYILVIGFIFELKEGALDIVKPAKSTVVKVE